jgi:hypothetical protein
MSEICTQPTMDFGMDPVSLLVLTERIAFARQELRHAIRTAQGSDTVEWLRRRLQWAENDLLRAQDAQGDVLYTYKPVWNWS